MKIRTSSHHMPAFYPVSKGDEFEIIITWLSGCWLAALPMDQRLKSYVRSLRRRYGFTQRELAFLIGTKSGTVISRVERMKRTPSFSAALACAVIFGVEPPGSFSEVRDLVLQPATTLYEELQGNPLKSTRNFLEILRARLEEDNVSDA